MTRGMPRSMRLSVVRTVASKFSPMATTAASISSSFWPFKALASVESMVMARATSSATCSTRSSTLSMANTSAPRPAISVAIREP